MKKLGIVSKLTLWYSFIMVVIASLMIGFLLYVVRRVTIDSVQKKLVDTITKASKEIEYEENISEEDDIYIEYGDAYIEIDEDYIKERNGVYIALYNLESDLLYGSLPPLDNIEKLPAFSEEIKEVEEEGLRYYIYDMPVKDKRLKNLWVRGIVMPTDGLRDISRISLIAVYTLPILVLISVLMGYMMARGALKPIESIRESALKIGSGMDLNRHIDIGEGDDELHKLVKVFNDMFDRLYNSFEKEKRFASDASHELRTPMTVIIAECEYLNSIKEDEGLSRNEYFEGLEVIYRQARRMNDIIKNLLDFTRIGRNFYEKEPINISELIKGICYDMKLINTDSNISLDEEIEDEIYVYANKNLVYRMLVNIISNAYTYGKKNGHIYVSLYKDKEVNIVIRDDGIGISDKDLSHIFERFYRAESSRTGKGTGLGLAMAMEIARWHGGDISVESKENKGSCFSIILPLDPEI